MRARGAVAGLVVAAAALAGCSSESGPVTVGAKDFTEQQILAEMVAQLATERGARVERIIPYPGEVSPVGGVIDGTVDVYVEYVGTALLELGLPPLPSDEAAYELVVRESEERGLTWLPRLGFANDYAIVVTPDFAARFDLDSLSDLRRVNRPLRFGADPEYLRRPVDGLSALESRYGFAASSDTLTTTDKQQLYGALSTGVVDVVQGFSTDPQIDILDLVVLEDDSNFFPSYDAAPLTRPSLLEAQPELEEALRDLAGMLDEETMRRLIEQVDLEQREAELVAREELIKLGLLPDDAVLDPRGDALVVAIGLEDERSGATGRAIDAIRTAYPGRPIEVVVVQDPADAVVRGEARMAVADAETVFEPEARAAGRERDVKPLEGIAAVELRSLHLLDEPGRGAISSVAVGEPNSPSYETALTLVRNGFLEDVSIEVVPGGSISDRVDAVRRGRVDAALAVSPFGHPEIQQALDDEGLVLRPVETGPELAIGAPHLRPGIIPPDSYRGQDEAVSTVTQQAVVVGPVSDPLEPGLHGPNAFAGGDQQPIAPAAIASLQDTLSEPRVDPVLPRAPRSLTSPEDLVQPTNPNPWVSVVNVLILLALAALGIALVRRSRGRPEEDADEDDSGQREVAEPVAPGTRKT